MYNHSYYQVKELKRSKHDPSPSKLAVPPTDAAMVRQQDYMDNNLAIAIAEARAPFHRGYLHQAIQFLIDTGLAFELGDDIQRAAVSHIRRGYCDYDPDKPKQYLISRPLAPLTNES